MFGGFATFTHTQSFFSEVRGGETRAHAEDVRVHVCVCVCVCVCECVCARARARLLTQLDPAAFEGFGEALELLQVDVLLRRLLLDRQVVAQQIAAR